MTSRTVDGAFLGKMSYSSLADWEKRNQSMRLLVLSSEFPPGPGGIGTHAHQVSHNLVRAGWQVTAISPQDHASEEQIRDFNESQPFPIVRLPSQRGALVVAALRWRILIRCIRMRKPDILLGTGERSAWLAAAASRLYKLPWVAVGHGTEFGVSNVWASRATRWSFECASAVVCVSQYTRRLMVESGINPRRELVIPNGGDDVRFRVLPAGEIKSFRQSLGKDADHLLLTVGNVTERKGQEVVIRALPHILKVARKTHYLMAGLPTLKHELTELACELGVAEHVHFLGRVDADSLVKYLNCCDVFVMTSRLTKDGDCEGFGIAVVEAALCGKPAVVSANSGLAEAIIDGSTGIAVPEGDEVATANALLSLLKDPQLRHTMGKAALDLAQREQSWRTRSGEYDKLLGGLLDGFHRRSLKGAS